MKIAGLGLAGWQFALLVIFFGAAGYELAQWGFFLSPWQNTPPSIVGIVMGIVLLLIGIMLIFPGDRYGGCH